MTLLRASLLCLLATLSTAAAQVLPDGVTELPFSCPARESAREEPRDPAELAEAERRARYRQVFPAYLAAVPAAPDPALLMPLPGVSVRSVADTWGGPRDGGRRHEGQDIFAPLGTPVFAAAPGFVYRVGPNRRGGNTVVVVAAGGYRHYYAHLDRFGDIREGQAVGVDTIIGYVGNSGNAASTPPHLHLGVYGSTEDPCDWAPVNPLPLLIDRSTGF